MKAVGKGGGEEKEKGKRKEGGERKKKTKSM